MRTMLTIIAAVAAVSITGAHAGAAMKNRAELNFGSTHPGTVTGTGGATETQGRTLRIRGEAPGLAKGPVETRQRINYTGSNERHTRSIDDLPPGFALDHRSPSQ